jgi:hypothetical protein
MITDNKKNSGFAAFKIIAVYSPIPSFAASARRIPLPSVLAGGCVTADLFSHLCLCRGSNLFVDCADRRRIFSGENCTVDAASMPFKRE